ncbi:putative immunity protein [Streptomyces griseoviridis]
MGDEVPISDEERRLLAGWAADCAERVLPLFEKAAPGDPRPRAALDAVRLYARDGRRTGALRSAAWAAQKAAGEAGDPSAAAAARAACCAAATPYLHPLATAHQSRHILAPAVHAARARDLAHGRGAATEAGDDEIRDAIERCPAPVRELLSRMPPRNPGRGRPDTLYHRLDGALRGCGPRR